MMEHINEIWHDIVKQIKKFQKLSIVYSFS